jgi:hypothetical protein
MMTWSDDDGLSTARSTVDHTNAHTNPARGGRPAARGLGGRDGTGTDTRPAGVANPRRVRLDADGRPVTASGHGAGRS